MAQNDEESNEENDVGDNNNNEPFEQQAQPFAFGQASIEVETNNDDELPALIPQGDMVDTRPPLLTRLQHLNCCKAIYIPPNGVSTTIIRASCRNGAYSSKTSSAIDEGDADDIFDDNEVDDADDDEDFILDEDDEGCLHCSRPAGSDVQVRCYECNRYICNSCHWCHEFQANHEIRVCDRCDAFYCRHCDEMDQCDDCGEVVCASCSTLLSCKFCGGGLCEECATACGR